MKKKYKIGEVVPLRFSLHETPRIWEKALEQAKKCAMFEFGVNDAGMAENVEDFDRGGTFLKIEFRRVRMIGGSGGWSYEFSFDYWCENHYGDTKEDDS